MLRELVKKILNYLIAKKLNLSGKYYISSNVKLLHAKIDAYVSINKNTNILWSEIGKYTYIGSDSELSYTKIGRFCSIAPHVILAAGLHPINYVSTHPVLYNGMGYRMRGGISTPTSTKFDELRHIKNSKKILCEIGNDVWIATRVTLVCGKSPLHIGNGAVIAAGAVVTKDVPDYAIVMGCPAKVVGYRFEEKVCKELLASKWWEKDDIWMNERINLMDNPYQFIESCNQIRY